MLLSVSAIMAPASFSYNSIFSINGLGLEMSPYNIRERSMGHAGMASIRNGASVSNPSRTGFNNRTTFEAIFETDLVYIQDDVTSNTLGSSRIPFIGMNFQAGRLGSLGLHYFQRFEKDFTYFPPQTGGAPYEQIKYEAGSYEIAFSLARQWFNKFAAGVSYHFLLGRDREINEGQFSQEGFVVVRDTAITNWSGGYPRLSFSYRYKKISLAAMATVWGKLKEKKQRRITNQQSASPSRREFDLPITIGLGLDYKFSRRHEMVLDVSTTDWDKRIDNDIDRSYRAGLGYENQGQGGKYDPYYSKIAIRTGLGYEKLYVLDVDVYKWTLGVGLPLGKRGNNMDIAFELGRRGSESWYKVREDYLKLYISLIGAGIWGRTSRSK